MDHTQSDYDELQAYTAELEADHTQEEYDELQAHAAELEAELRSTTEEYDATESMLFAATDHLLRAKNYIEELNTELSAQCDLTEFLAERVALLTEGDIPPVEKMGWDLPRRERRKIDRAIKKAKKGGLIPEEDHQTDVGLGELLEQYKTDPEAWGGPTA